MTSPITRKRLTKRDLIPNRALRDAIIDGCRRAGKPPPANPENASNNDDSEINTSILQSIALERPGDGESSQLVDVVPSESSAVNSQVQEEHSDTTTANQDAEQDIEIISETSNHSVASTSPETAIESNETPAAISSPEDDQFTQSPTIDEAWDVRLPTSIRRNRLGYAVTLGRGRHSNKYYCGRERGVSVNVPAANTDIDPITTNTSTSSRLPTPITMQTRSSEQLRGSSVGESETMARICGPFGGSQCQDCSGLKIDTPINSSGYFMRLGHGVYNDRYYCGRQLGAQMLFFSGQCGPKHGPQCHDCSTYQLRSTTLLSNARNTRNVHQSEDIHINQERSAIGTTLSASSRMIQDLFYEGNDTTTHSNYGTSIRHHTSNSLSYDDIFVSYESFGQNRSRSRPRNRRNRSFDSTDMNTNRFLLRRNRGNQRESLREYSSCSIS